MTASELIAKLQKAPPDAEIRIHVGYEDEPLEHVINLQGVIYLQKAELDFGEIEL